MARTSVAIPQQLTFPTLTNGTQIVVTVRRNPVEREFTAMMIGRTQ